MTSYDDDDAITVHDTKHLPLKAYHLEFSTGKNGYIGEEYIPAFSDVYLGLVIVGYGGGGLCTKHIPEMEKVNVCNQCKFLLWICPFSFWNVFFRHKIPLKLYFKPKIFFKHWLRE